LKISTVVVARAENQRPYQVVLPLSDVACGSRLARLEKVIYLRRSCKTRASLVANDIHTQPRFHTTKYAAPVRRNGDPLQLALWFQPGSMSSGTVLESWNLSRRKLNFRRTFPSNVSRFAWTRDVTIYRLARHAAHSEKHKFISYLSDGVDVLEASNGKQLRRPQPRGT
jgi:hypothetical protein